MSIGGLDGDFLRVAALRVPAVDRMERTWAMNSRSSSGVLSVKGVDINSIKGDSSDKGVCDLLIFVGIIWLCLEFELGLE